MLLHDFFRPAMFARTRWRGSGRVARMLASCAFAAFLALIPSQPPAAHPAPTVADTLPAPQALGAGTVPAPSSPDLAGSLPAQLAGWSGKLRAIMGTSSELLRNPWLQPLAPALTLDRPGIYPMNVALQGMQGFSVLALAPFEQLRTGSLHAYHVGRWPAGLFSRIRAMYAPPEGFIEVTLENEATRVSESFKLADFLTHDQQGLWPKVLVLRAPLLDKLELIRAELARRSLPSQLHVMSGFRTPQYNALGVGERGGRATYSRHMYGDAADVFVDADGDGLMDDLDGDHRITVKDAQVLLAAAEAVESDYPDLVGGLSAYGATPAHGPFVHVDVRGFRARW